MKTAICYFSGTGNGLDIAKRLATLLGGADLYYLPHCDVAALAPYDCLVLVTPVYMFGLPNNVKAFIKQLAQAGGASLYMVLHYGGVRGNAKRYAYDRCRENGLNVQKIYAFTMPINYTIVANEPAFYMKYQLSRMPGKVAKIAADIQREGKKVPRRSLVWFSDRLHEKMQAAWADLPESFVVGENCTRCGQCVAMCPVNNIKVNGDGVHFMGQCVSCLACFQRCPRQAIDYGKATVGKPRYVNPNVNLEEMS